MAIDMGEELEHQNKQVDRLHDKVIVLSSYFTHFLNCF